MENPVHIIDIHDERKIVDDEVQITTTTWDFSQKECIVYFSQLSVVLIVIIFSVVNLSIGKSNTELWASLLSACLGYIMPSPSMEKIKYYPSTNL
jgi:hypothetical protein